VSEILLTVGALATVGQVGATLRVAFSEEPGPWPPTEENGRFGLYWLSMMGMAGSFFALLATTHGSLYAASSLTVAVGGLLGLVGAAVNVWTADTFDDPEEILGLHLGFHTDGPFRLSRNPSVLGHLGAVGGLAVAAGSWQALLLAGGIGGWFALKPFAEEPALQRAYGSRYRHYRARVARYLDVDRLRDSVTRCGFSRRVDC
jgi:protein-S-isoprenylcysteine O-methyltransferase Ste14